MKATCEKPHCNAPAESQAEFKGVTVARACAEHTPDLIEFVNRHAGVSIPNGTEQRGMDAEAA